MDKEDYIYSVCVHTSQVALVVKNPSANSLSMVGFIAGWGRYSGGGRYPGGRHGNPLQYSCLENPMDRGAWWATVHRVPKTQTWLKWWANTHTHTHKYN